MTNTDLRTEAKAKGIYLWQVAESLGIQDTALSKKLRRELSKDEKEKIRAIIKELAKN